MAKKVIIHRIVLLIVIGLFLNINSVTADDIKLEVNEYVLKNGMKVLVLERHTSPTVAVNLVFRVGSTNERPGLTGVSHFLEHMLFKGTQAIGTKDYTREKPVLDKIDNLTKRLAKLRKVKDKQVSVQPTVEDQEIKILQTQLDELLEIHRTYRITDELRMIYRRHGAMGLNAFTLPEITYYHTELPSNKLELWAWLESDRLTHPVWREFYQEKNVIMEERRFRYETNPQGLLYERFMSTAYLAHPLGYPMIGWPSDIKSITKEQLNQWFQTYYVPNNTIAVIVGDVDTDYVLSLMRTYFEPIPARASPPLVTTIEPAQSGERRVRIEYDAQPFLLIGYHTTTLGHKDSYVLDIISEILSGGRISRLYRKFLCLSIGTDNAVSKYPGLFKISATPRHPYTSEEVEQAIYDELDRLKQEPVSKSELARAKKCLETSFLRNLNSNANLSFQLGYYEALYDWRYILDVSGNRNAVTTQDIQRVAQKYFITTNRTVATLTRKETPVKQKGKTK